MRSYLRERRLVILAFLLFAAVFSAVFVLGGLPMGALGYALLVCVVLGAAFAAVDIVRYRRRCSVLKKLREEITVATDGLPEPTGEVEAGYQELVEILFRSRAEIQENSARNIADMTDYYTMWAHQIKTPIAAMRLTLAEFDAPESRELSAELQRISQYVDMVMCYVRLESGGDYVFRECDLDGIVRSAVRSFSGQFIRKKLTLTYEPLDHTVLTDEKWLLFVVEQVLSNAVKYTRTGGVTIRMNGDALEISDTGIGIAPEDLPRIFEKGYTGCNGRTDMKASGIGLYLCRRICRALGHTISASSSESGTVVSIDLSRDRVDLRE